MERPKLDLLPIPRVPSLTKAEFRHTYLLPSRPVIMTELACSWPALKKWSPEFFKTRYGERPVRVYNAGFTTPGRSYMSNAQTLSFRDYLDLILTASADLRMFLYNVKREIPELLDDIKFPPIADGFSRNFVFMFFGCKGSVTQMHFDLDMSHVFHTALYGKKRVFLFPYEERAHLYHHPFTCRSYVDVDKPDFTRFPGLSRAKGYETVLAAGETLFMPAGYWHHMVYEEAGYALSLRCSNHRPAGRLQGYLYLGVLSPIDRVMNKICPTRWFRWKEQYAAQRA